MEEWKKIFAAVLFPGIGREGQQKLAAARVALVGCGATGSALASLLARAGVGTIRIIDRDYVEPRICNASPCSMNPMRSSRCPRRSPPPARFLPSILRL